MQLDSMLVTQKNKYICKYTEPHHVYFMKNCLQSILLSTKKDYTDNVISTYVRKINTFNKIQRPHAFSKKYIYAVNKRKLCSPPKEKNWNMFTSHRIRTYKNNAAR